MLAMLLERDVARAAVLPMDWPEWSRMYPAFAAAPFLRRVVDGQTAGAGAREASDRVSMKAAVLAADESARQVMVSELVARSVAGVLRLPVSEVDVAMPLRNVGLDSLMALELRNTLQDRIGVAVPLVALVEGPSITELTSLILRALADLPAEAPPEAVSGINADLKRVPAEVDELSDESVDALLRRMLAEP
jgi:acyl carrier protein